MVAIQQQMNGVISSFNAQVEKLENNLEDQKQYASKILQNPHPRQQGIQFLKLEYEVEPKELETLNQQLQKYEESLQQMKKLQEKVIRKAQGEDEILLYDQILDRSYSKNYKISRVLKQKTNILQAQVNEQLRVLAFSCEDKCLYIWDYQFNSTIDIYDNQSIIYSIRFSSEWPYSIYIGDEAGIIKAFIQERNNDFRLKQLNQYKEHKTKIKYLVDKSQNELISSSLDNTIKINEISTGILIRKIQLEQYVQSNFDYECFVNLIVSPDGPTLKIWNADFEQVFVQQNVQFVHLGFFVMTNCKREVKIFEINFKKKTFSLINRILTNYRIKNVYCPFINKLMVLILDGCIHIADVDVGKFKVVDRIPFNAVEYL